MTFGDKFIPFCASERNRLNFQFLPFFRHQFYTFSKHSSSGATKSSSSDLSALAFSFQLHCNHAVNHITKMIFNKDTFCVSYGSRFVSQFSKKENFFNCHSYTSPFSSESRVIKTEKQDELNVPWIVES